MPSRSQVLVLALVAPCPVSEPSAGAGLLIVSKPVNVKPRLFSVPLNPAADEEVSTTTSISVPVSVSLPAKPLTVNVAPNPLSTELIRILSAPVLPVMVNVPVGFVKVVFSKVPALLSSDSLSPALASSLSVAVLVPVGKTNVKAVVMLLIMLTGSKSL